jgi:hypothetical protein
MVNNDLATWLAAATGDDPVRVAAELELGERRREFVFNELVEAGYSGGDLLDYLVRLTGMSAQDARAAVADYERRLVDAAEDASPRDARLAQNEIAFRDGNEVVAHGGPGLPVPTEVELICECSDRNCRRVLTMPFAEYEWLRQNPWRFVVLPGHDAPAIERVVELHPAYAIVEKHAESRSQVESADPRR